MLASQSVETNLVLLVERPREVPADEVFRNGVTEQVVFVGCSRGHAPSRSIRDVNLIVHHHLRGEHSREGGRE